MQRRLGQNSPHGIWATSKEQLTNVAEILSLQKTECAIDKIMNLDKLASVSLPMADLVL